MLVSIFRCTNHFVQTSLIAIAMVGGLGTGLLAQDTPNNPDSLPGFSDPATQDEQDQHAAQKPIQKTGADKIRFSFDQQQWKPIIEYFAEEAGYSLQPITEPPQGTFNYQDDREYTILEALDLINGALRLRGYTLIRNNKMLVLLKDTELPEDLIDTVSPDELDERGKYEVLRCVYEIDNLEGMNVEEQIGNLVARNYVDFFKVFPAANKMIVVETGGNLRTIRGLLSEARRKSLAGSMVFQQYKTKYVDPESLLVVVRGMMDIPEGMLGTPDGTFRFTVEPLGDKIFIKGTQDRIDEFLNITKTVDQEEIFDDGPAIARPFLRKYATVGQPELVFQVLQTMLDGREGVQLDQDEQTGSIIVRARQEDHDIVIQVLAELAKNPNSWAQIPVTSDPADILIKLQAMFQVDEEGNTEGPILLADTDNDLIIVRGKPQEVTLVKEMVAEFDKASARLTGPRSNTRIIEIKDADKTEDLVGMMEDLFAQTGRRNRFKYVMPDKRLESRQKNRGLPSRGLPDPDKSKDEIKLPEPTDKKNDGPASGTNKDTSSTSMMNSAMFALSQFSAAHYMSILIQDPKGQTSEEATGRQQRDGYKPPTQMPSIPNSPIEIRQTEFGIVITSDDLDALDDLEYMIRDRLELNSEVQLPTVFYLKHRKVDEAIVVLENVLGIGDGGGGGGGGAGGIGGMMAGMMGNALGGGAGDLLGGLLGGDDSLAGSSGLELEGDVRISTDIALNTLIISGATENDLDLVSELIEYIDQEQPPHDPNFEGKTYVIPIAYRNPEELKNLVEGQLPDLIKKESAGGANQQQQQAQQMAQMAQMMKSITGGGGRGNAKSQNPDAERPKATLGVDTTGQSLLVTGPEFIYNRVLQVVHELDKPEFNQAKEVETLKLDGKLNASNLPSILAGIFGNKIIDGGTAQNSNGQPASSSAGGNPNRPDTNSAQQQQAAEIQGQMMQAIQRARAAQAAGGGGRGGGGTRGGGGRGGGGRGGGGRGGR